MYLENLSVLYGAKFQSILLSVPYKFTTGSNSLLSRYINLHDIYQFTAYGNRAPAIAVIPGLIYIYPLKKLKPHPEPLT